MELAGPLEGERAARGHGAVGRVGEGGVAEALGGAADQQLARGVGGERVADRQQAGDHVRVLGAGELHLSGEDLGRQKVRAGLQHLRGGPGRPLGVAGVDEVPPGAGQPAAQLRIRLAGAGVAFEGIDQVGAVRRLQRERHGSPLNGLPDGRRRRRGRGAGEARRQQDAEDRRRGDPAPWGAPDLRRREAPRRWWQWHACK